jgi:hypothetical protein
MPARAREQSGTRVRYPFVDCARITACYDYIDAILMEPPVEIVYRVIVFLTASCEAAGRQRTVDIVRCDTSY